MNRDLPDGASGEDGKPPVGGSWRALYAGVLGALALVVALLALLTRAYR